MITKKIAHMVVLSALILVNGASLQADGGFIKKVLKVAWHTAEVYAGGHLAKQVWNRHFKYPGFCEREAYCIGAFSLLYHGVYGINKELKLIKGLESFLK